MLIVLQGCGKGGRSQGKLFQCDCLLTTSCKTASVPSALPMLNSTPRHRICSRIMELSLPEADADHLLNTDFVCVPGHRPILGFRDDRAFLNFAPSRCPPTRNMRSPRLGTLSSTIRSGYFASIRTSQRARRPLVSGRSGYLACRSDGFPAMHDVNFVQTAFHVHFSCRKRMG